MTFLRAIKTGIFAAVCCLAAACSDFDQRVDRLELLTEASAHQISAIWEEPQNASKMSLPIRERAIRDTAEKSRDPQASRNTRYVLSDSLILSPAPEKTDDPGSDEDSVLPNTVSMEHILEGLKAYGLTYRVSPMLDGSVRLEIGRENTSERAWAERVLVRHGAISPCPATSGLQNSAQLDDESLLSCLVKYLGETHAFTEVLPDRLLQPAEAASFVPASGPVADAQWAFQPIPFDSVSGLVLAILDNGVLKVEEGPTGADLVTSPEAANDENGPDRMPAYEADVCDPDNALDRESQHGPAMFSLLSGGTPAFNAVSPGLRPLNVRIAGRCGARLSDMVDGLVWAGGLAPVLLEQDEPFWNDTPADIIVLPYSTPGACPIALQQIFDAFDARGITVFVPAGNNAAPASDYYPGNCRHVMTVTASDRQGELASYSNYGADVDVMAPGGDLTQDSDADGWPDGIIVPVAATECRDPVSNARIENCEFALRDGTSLATLIAAARFAELRSHAPEMSVREARDAFFAGLSDIPGSACRGACPDTPGGAPIQFMPGQCFRACGTGALTPSDPPSAFNPTGVQ